MDIVFGKYTGEYVAKTVFEFLSDYNDKTGQWRYKSDYYYSDMYIYYDYASGTCYRGTRPLNNKSIPVMLHERKFIDSCRNKGVIVGDDWVTPELAQLEIHCNHDRNCAENLLRLMYS